MSGSLSSPVAPGLWQLLGQLTQNGQQQSNPLAALLGGGGQQPQANQLASLFGGGGQPNSNMIANALLRHIQQLQTRGQNAQNVPFPTQGMGPAGQVIPGPLQMPQMPQAPQIAPPVGAQAPASPGGGLGQPQLPQQPQALMNTWPFAAVPQ